MVDGIKDHALIKESQDDSVAVVNCSEEIVKYLKNGGLRRSVRWSEQPCKLIAQRQRGTETQGGPQAV